MAWHIVERSEGIRFLATHESREEADAHRDELIAQDAAYRDVLFVMSTAGDPPVPERVVRRTSDGFAFTLPKGHLLDILDEPDDAGRPLAYIGIPGAGGETCRLVDIANRTEEREYVLEPTGVRHSIGGEEVGYSWPRVQDEHDRLRVRWEAAGGDLTRFDASSRGTDIGTHFEQLRAEIRALERATEPS